MSNAAGTVAGSFVNAFAVNEASILHVLAGELTIGFVSVSVVHSLSGKMTAGCAGHMDAVRRTNAAAQVAISLNQTAIAIRRNALNAKSNISLRAETKISQRHGTQCGGGITLDSSHAITRRRMASGYSQLRLAGRFDSHVRRSASVSGKVSLSSQIVHARRRQIACGQEPITFLHYVNMRAFSPIYARSKIELKEAATSVRRVGVPAKGICSLTGIVGVVARRCFNSTSLISFTHSIKMPHVRMVPTEPYRDLRILPDQRSLTIPQETRSIEVRHDGRSFSVSPDRMDLSIHRRQGRI